MSSGRTYAVGVRLCKLVSQMLFGTREAPLVVLLVEDNRPDAELIALRLGSVTDPANTTPVRLLLAETLAAASATLRREIVDVIILDLSLPDSSGLEALHRVRAEAPGVPVIALTGREDHAMALEALRAGAQDYVVKPPPRSPGLRRILQYACERQRLLQERDSAIRSSTMLALRWRVLAEVGEALAAPNEPSTAIAQAMHAVVPNAADGLVIHVIGDQQLPSVLEVVHAEGDRAADLGRRMRLAASALFGGLGRVFSDRAISGSEVASRYPPATELLAAFGITPAVALPIRAAGSMRGLLILANGRHESVVDGEFARSLADRFGLWLDQTRLMRQAQDAAQGRERAVGIVSHDLGNPLTTIEICASALLDRDPPPMSGVRNMAHMIEHSAAVMRRIVRDLLDRASLDAGRLALDKHPTAVDDIVNEAHALFAPTAIDREVELVIESATGLPCIDADPSRLLQVLSNLLSNALKFTQPGGRVVLSTRLTNEPQGERLGQPRPLEEVRFMVSDNGPGIPAEDLTHVFDWFWHSCRDSRGGTGLGLAIAKGLIEAHRGQLNVESTPGVGSKFWFTVPAVLAEVAATA
jgi:signal transduction histidine kinase/DNA-binding NarL/FixJ family response regulator